MTKQRRFYDTNTKALNDDFGTLDFLMAICSKQEDLY